MPLLDATSVIPQLWSHPLAVQSPLLYLIGDGRA
jgi:hypothetical protein